MMTILKKAAPISLTLQQVLIGVLGLAFSVAIFKTAHLPTIEVVHKLQYVLIAFALGCLIQAYGYRQHISSGLFLPAMSGAIYVNVSILALTIGGIPLLIGMTLFAAVTEFTLSFFMKRLRFFFPPEINGLVILFVGLELGHISLKLLVLTHHFTNLYIFLWTLIPIILLSVWGSGYFRHIASLIGVFCGAVATFFLMGTHAIDIHHAAWFAYPHLHDLMNFKVRFDWGLVIPFALVALIAALRVISLGISVQQFMDPDWKAPDHVVLNRAIRSDSIISFVAALLGVNGLNVSPTATTLAIASGYTKRRLFVSMAIIFLLLVFLPKILFFFADAPLAIVAAILMYYAVFIFISGIRIIGGQTFGIKQIFTTGISFFAALSAIVYPKIYQHLPYLFQIVSNSPLALGLVCALVMNLFFYLGLRRYRHFTLDCRGQVSRKISSRLYQYGTAWKLKRDMMDSIVLISKELCQQIYHSGVNETPIRVKVIHTSGHLTLRFEYEGTLFKLYPFKRLTQSDILDEELFVSGIQHYLRGCLIDDVHFEAVKNQCRIQVTFQYQ